MIHLHKVAPWNPKLRNSYRERFAQVGDRYFRVESGRMDAPWLVFEIDASGDLVDDRPSVALCFNLPAARQAIQDRVDGMDPDAVCRKALNAPRAGTGRNHPRHVAERWRGRYRN